MVNCLKNHEPGEHDISCIPPADPGNVRLRLLRAIYGLCPDCNHDDKSHYDGNDYGQTHHCKECKLDIYRVHGPAAYPVTCLIYNW